MPRPSKPLYFEGPCRHCGRTLILDEAKLKSSHEAPECEWYARVIASAKRPPVRTVEFRDEMTGELRPIIAKA